MRDGTVDYDWFSVEYVEGLQATATRRLELLREVEIRRELYQEACLFCSGESKHLPDCKFEKELADDND